MIPIETILQEFMLRAMAPKPTNLTHIKALTKKVWANISMEMYPKLGETLILKSSKNSPKNKSYDIDYSTRK